MSENLISHLILADFGKLEGILQQTHQGPALIIMGNEDSTHLHDHPEPEVE